MALDLTGQCGVAWWDGMDRKNFHAFVGNRVLMGGSLRLRFPKKMTIINFPITSTEQEAAEALDTLMRVFDIADVSSRETIASLDYNQSRIDVAREALKQNPNERERLIYGAWLDFFQEKTRGARSKSAP